MLQWKFYDKLAHTHLSPLDTLTAAATTHVHKAKVMYYYETLNSVDYKGSMTSLQSCQSGFSSISRHSTSGVSSGMSSSHSEKLPRSLVSVMDHNNGSGKKWRKPKHNKHVNFWWCKWLITEYATITYSAQDLNSPFRTSILMNFQSFIKVKILPKFSFAEDCLKFETLYKQENYFYKNEPSAKIWLYYFPMMMLLKHTTKQEL